MPWVTWELSHGVCVGDVTKVPTVEEGGKGVGAICGGLCPAVWPSLMVEDEEREPQQGAGEGRSREALGQSLEINMDTNESWEGQLVFLGNVPSPCACECEHVHAATCSTNFSTSVAAKWRFL